MPRNKEAYIRYKVINRCLKDFQYSSMERLIRACEDALDISPISERTIYKDIRDMKNDLGLSFHAPIRYSKIKGGYYYTDPNYSTDNIPLNKDELQALSFASGILDQYNNISFFGTFSDAIRKIVDGVKLTRMLTHKPDAHFIDFEKTPVVKGAEYLPFLVNAIIEKQVIQLQYQAFYQTEPFLHLIHPYFLKEYRNRWYIIGLHEKQKTISIFGLDRILSLENVRDVLYQEPEINFRDYFSHTIGVFSPPGDPPLIKLRFTPFQARYILSQPIHESQEMIEKSEDWVMIQLRVHPTPELKMMILGWGPEVEVLEPDYLREWIGEALEKSLLKYGR